MHLSLPLQDVRVSTHAFALPGLVIPASIVREVPLTPYFTRDAVALLLSHLLECGAAVQAGFDDETDSVRVQLASEPAVTHYEGVDIERPDGRIQHLYCLGAGVWPWEQDA